MNFNLIKCAIGKHQYGRPCKDETLNVIKKFCTHCNRVETIVKSDELKQYNENKREIINHIELDELAHTKRKLNILLKDLGY